ncbi:hypothetical protein [Rhizobium sp. ZW T2_16]|uniref:hypothetical protein n=1 Tax=Rhizobium sp. ZW T2_16 TaxID=3378083 RepID=UPI003853A58E
MGSSSDKAPHSRGLAAARERFPDLLRQIDNLFELDEEFRVLCEDLADVKTALNECRHLPAVIRDARRLEYEELIDSLAKEIEQALSRANVILLRPPRH